MLPTCAHRSDLSSSWTWIGTDGSAGQNLPAVLVGAMKGMIGLQPTSGEGPLWDAFIQRESEFDVDHLVDASGSTLQWIPHLVDAVSAVRLAVSRGRASFRESQGLVTMPNSTQMRKVFAVGLASIDQTHSFRGTIGRDVFFDEFHDGPPHYDLVNLRSDGSWVRVGSFAPDASSGSQALELTVSQQECATSCLENSACIIWADGDCSPPGAVQPLVRNIRRDTVAIAVGAGTAVVIIVLFVVILRQRRRLEEKNHAYDFVTTLAKLSMDTQIGDRITPREIHRSSVTFLEVLGSGNFGNVQKALLDEHATLGVPSYICAAKTLLPDVATGAELQQLLLEAAMTAQMDHIHVLSLIGVVTKGEPVCLLLQYCEFGALDAFLQKRSGLATIVTPKERRKMALGICSGMEHIHSRGVMHRDLAARNILLKTGMVVCVADFGLAKDNEYYQSRGGALPIRWYPPETMTENRFGKKGDVWSFGVTMWEIWTDCMEIPWARHSTAAVMVHVPAGERLKLPHGCTREDQRIVNEAMQLDYNARPSFTVLVDLIQQVQLRLEEAERPVAFAQSRESATSALVQEANPLNRFSPSMENAGTDKLRLASADSTRSLPCEILGHPSTTSDARAEPERSERDKAEAEKLTSYTYVQMGDPLRSSLLTSYEQPSASPSAYEQALLAPNAYAQTPAYPAHAAYPRSPMAGLAIDIVQSVRDTSGRVVITQL